MATTHPADPPAAGGSLASAAFTMVALFALLLFVATLLAWVGDGPAPTDPAMDCAVPACAGPDACAGAP